ncbi:rhodanese-like domain-containing protein [Psychrobacillus sp.]|uniref:rhodanese-like domain-containing protein n=1 Tax=Psychrobacillus sp. TaxID=1871623 RepID=UPI0028BEA1AF|nr:rhodanese-like domain-containing protein [Psychrobacillus sp.]
MNTITTEELLQKIEAGEMFSLIDVRESDEVATGVIPGAVHIPLGSVDVSLDQIDKAIPHIIICKAGGRSAKACEILEENGYNVTNLVGGMMAWEGELEF